LALTTEHRRLQEENVRVAGERGGPFGRTAVDALAFAEAQGAAPGTEFRGFGPAESSPLGRRAHRTRPRRTLIALAAACLLVAFWHGGQAAYVYAKAALGQELLLRSWEESRARGAAAKPWPWADTHPVARLRVPAHNVDLLVLAGANGRTLAWGPGHVEGTATPGSRGNAVVTGHRDTHFAFLRDVKRGDALHVESADGTAHRYRVERTFVADRASLALPADDRATTLALVTCYPFDAIDPGTSLRYAVVARAVP
jgi:sortase A